MNKIIFIVSISFRCFFVSPEINIIIEGNADESVIDLLKKESKNIANMVAEEFNRSRSNKGYKTKLKPT